MESLKTVTRPSRAPDAVEAFPDDPFRIAVDTVPGLVWTALADGHVDFLNQRWRDYTGLSLDEASGWGWQQAVHPEDLPGLVGYWQSILRSGNPGEMEARLRSHDGEFRWFHFRAVPLRDERGDLRKWYGTITEIEDRKRAEALLAGEKRILEMIAKGQPLARTLDAICRLVGEFSPGSLCSILLLDWGEHRFRHGGAPDLPETYNLAMDGRGFEFSSGACARAAKSGEQVIVPDITVDSIWADGRELPLGHGLRSCWSTPIFSQVGKVIGVFAIYSQTPCLPGAYQLHLIDQLTDIASIAIERDQAAKALQASEHLARGQLEALAGSLSVLSRESLPEKFLEHILRIAGEQLDACLVRVWEMNERIGCVELSAHFHDGVLYLPAKSENEEPAGSSLEVSDHPVWSEFFRTGDFCVHGRILSEPPWAEVAAHWDGPWHDWRAREVDNPKVPRMIRDIVSSGVVATLNVPMTVADKVTGFFTLHFKQRRPFRQDEMALTRAMANQAMLTMQLARLSAQSRAAAVVEERNRLARDIHDTLAQGFAGIIVQLDAAGDAKSREMHSEAAAHVARASELARDSLGEARRSVRALRPLALEEKSLPCALEELFGKMTAGTSLRLAFSAHGMKGRLPPGCEENLLRIGQEVLANALRHAGAATFETTITFTPNRFTMELRDDGCGFDPLGKYDGFGLTGIKERVEEMAGKLLLESEPGKGSRVRIDLRIDRPIA